MQVWASLALLNPFVFLANYLGFDFISIPIHFGRSDLETCPSV